MKRWRLLILILLAGASQADPIDEALALAERHSASLNAKEYAASAVAKQSDWEATVRVGYAMKGTSDSAAGLDAGINVTIPLFSKKREIEAAEARIQVTEARQSLRDKLLNAVAKLDDLEAKRAEAEELFAFYSDRLAYFKKAVEEGRAESDTLWTDAEKAKKAEHDALQGRVKLDAALTETARKFGGDEWRALRTLLTGYVQRNRPLRDES